MHKLRKTSSTDADNRGASRPTGASTGNPDRSLHDPEGGVTLDQMKEMTLEDLAQLERRRRQTHK